MTGRQQRLCAELARLLSYPQGDVADAARRARDLAEHGTSAAVALARFAGASASIAPSALEELYTATFDLQPACTPYLGVHLLGDESPVRGAFRDELLEDALLPALGKMIASLDDLENPYRELLVAARDLLGPPEVGVSPDASAEVRP